MSGQGPVAMRLPDQAAKIRQSLDVEVTIFQFQRSSVAQVLTNIRLKALEHLLDRKPTLTVPAAEAKLGKQDEIILLKPNLWGVGVDLKALWRKHFGRPLGPRR